MVSYAALFPGQGSQIVGMGEGFLRSDSLARDLFSEADSTLRYSLSQICFKGPVEKLTLTENAQPALLTVSTIAYQLFGRRASCAAGHSLGEYSALVAAECLQFADAVALVHKRGRYMQEAVESGAGKMIAILGADVESVQAAVSEVSKGVAEIANINCPGQTVAAGDNLGIDELTKIVTGKGFKTIPLNVSAPFHCRLMQPAADQLARDLVSTTFETPKIPVFSNVTAQRIQSGDEARDLLIQQVCSTVRWTESVQNMVERFAVTKAVEFGPGKVLSKLFKRIDKAVECSEVADAETLEAAKKAIS